METRVEPTFDEFEQASRIIGILGGLAGIGTALSAGLFWIYRLGYKAALKKSKEQQQARDIKAIRNKLKGNK